MANDSKLFANLRKKIGKKYDDVIMDLEQPTRWADSGNYVLNHILSGQFSKGFPSGRITQLFGDSGCLIPSETINIKRENSDTIETLQIQDVYNEWKNNNTTFYVDSPDGFQLASKFIEKDTRSCYTIKTPQHSISCSGDHLIETTSGWIKTEDLKEKTKILTKDGFELIETINKLDDSKVYDMTIEHDNHRYWGGTGISSHNTGKSFLTARTIAKAQEEGYMVVILDSEQAMSQDYLQKIGVDIDPSKIITIQVHTVEQTMDLMVDVLEDVKKTQIEQGNKDSIKLMLIVDSLGLLSSHKAAEDALKGSTAADMGTKAKALNKMFTAVTQKIGVTETVTIMTNHMMTPVGEMYPQPKPKGGQCLVAGTMVQTENGLKPIETITCDDKVKTHMGRFKPVVKLFDFDDLDILEVELDNGQIIKMTPEHKMLIDRDGIKMWVEARNITTDDSFLILTEEA